MEEQSERIYDVAKQVVSEMADRLESPLSENDGLAVRSAVLRATLRGFCEGTANAQFAFNEQHGDRLPEPVVINFGFDVPATLAVFDVWARRYGDEDEE